MVPGSPEKKTGRESVGVPARGLTGGELEVAREHEEVKAHRLVGLVRAGAVGWGVSHGEVRRRLGLLAGGCAAAVGWGCGEVWKLRDARAELNAGSAWAEGVWRSGPAAASSSPELRRRGRWCSGCLERETGGAWGGIGRKRMMPCSCALEKRRGLSTNQATSPAMWLQTGASGVRGRSGGGLARGEEGGEEPGHDAWKATASRRWPAALPRRRAAL